MKISHRIALILETIEQIAMGIMMLILTKNVTEWTNGPIQATASIIAMIVFFFGFLLLLFDSKNTANRGRFNYFNAIFPLIADGILLYQILEII